MQTSVRFITIEPHKDDSFRLQEQQTCALCSEVTMLSKRLETLHPYVPGEQPKDRSYIKLNANENPYPPCKAVSAAIRKVLADNRKKLGLYPDPDSLRLRKAIAGMLNKTGGVLASSSRARKSLPFKITPDMIFCGNGSDEVLSFLFCAFFDSGRPLVLPEFTYSFYPVYCGFYSIPMLKIPLKSDLSIDAEKMTEASIANKSPLIFANPNAPTGIALKRQEVEAMLQKIPENEVCIVDEAYADFSDESCLPLLQNHRNLVVVRTFSKSLSLAGMRLGFAVASPELIQPVFTVKNSFNHFPVDVLAQAAGTAACESYKYYEKNARKIAEERDSFIQFLREHGWTTTDSKTNFVFAKKEGTSGKSVYEAAKEAGILIRHFDIEGIEDFVRITVGTKKQMEKLKKILLERF